MRYLYGSYSIYGAKHTSRHSLSIIQQVFRFLSISNNLGTTYLYTHLTHVNILIPTQILLHIVLSLRITNYRYVTQLIIALGENIHVYVKPSEYMDKLSAHSLIRITAVANVQETGQLWSQDDDFAVQKPELNIEVSEILLMTYYNPMVEPN